MARRPPRVATRPTFAAPGRASCCNRSRSRAPSTRRSRPPTCSSATATGTRPTKPPRSSGSPNSPRPNAGCARRPRRPRRLRSEVPRRPAVRRRGAARPGGRDVHAPAGRGAERRFATPAGGGRHARLSCLDAVQRLARTCNWNLAVESPPLEERPALRDRRPQPGRPGSAHGGAADLRRRRRRLRVRRERHRSRRARVTLHVVRPPSRPRPSPGGSGLRSLAGQWYRSFLRDELQYEPLVQRESVQVRMHLGELLVESGDLEAAIPFFSEVFEKRPHDHVGQALLRSASATSTSPRGETDRGSRRTPTQQGRGVGAARVRTHADRARGDARDDPARPRPCSARRAPRRSRELVRSRPNAARGAAGPRHPAARLGRDAGRVAAVRRRRSSCWNARPRARDDADAARVAVLRRHAPTAVPRLPLPARLRRAGHRTSRAGDARARVVPDARRERSAAAACRLVLLAESYLAQQRFVQARAASVEARTRYLGDDGRRLARTHAEGLGAFGAGARREGERLRGARADGAARRRTGAGAVPGRRDARRPAVAAGHRHRCADARRSTRSATARASRPCRRSTSRPPPATTSTTSRRRRSCWRRASSTRTCAEGRRDDRRRLHAPRQARARRGRLPGDPAMRSSLPA
jgi:hypothetical protein